jgi:hypothetical protein
LLFSWHALNRLHLLHQPRKEARQRLLLRAVVLGFLLRWLVWCGFGALRFLGFWWQGSEVKQPQSLRLLARRCLGIGVVLQRGLCCSFAVDWFGWQRAEQIFEETYRFLLLFFWLLPLWFLLRFCSRFFLFWLHPKSSKKAGKGIGRLGSLFFFFLFLRFLFTLCLGS